MPGCCALNCRNRSDLGFRVFRFPSDQQRKAIWVQNMGRLEWQPKNSSTICEGHFEASQFEANRQDGWRKLKPNAVPTIFDVPNPPRAFESPYTSEKNVRKSSRRAVTKESPSNVHEGKMEESSCETDLEDEDIPKIRLLCRICLKTPTELFPLFEDENLAAKIKIISNVEVSSGDQLPKTICKECITNIDLAFDLRNLIITSDTDLKDHLKRSVSNAQSDGASLKREDDTVTVRVHQLIADIFGEDSNSMLENVEMVFAMNDDAQQTTNPEASTKGKQYRCELCNFSTADYTDWRKHYTSIPHYTKKNKPRECSDCKFTTTDFKVWLQHRRQHLKSRSKLRKCNDCSFSTTSWQRYQNHRKQHYERYGHKLRECKRCDFKTVDFRMWTRHQSRHRVKSKMTSPSGKSSTICSICGKAVRSIYNHLLTHTSEPVPCDQCGKSFKNSLSLSMHLRVHRGKFFECDVCGKRVTYYSMLIRHKRMHGIVKKMECTVCSKQFFDKQGVKQHMMSHTGQRRYPCALCAMGFYNKTSLARHITSKHGNDHVDEAESNAENVCK